MGRRPAVFPRKYRITMYCTESEHAKIRELAEKSGLDLSVAARMLLNMGHDVMVRQKKKEGSTGE